MALPTPVIPCTNNSPKFQLHTSPSLPSVRKLETYYFSCGSWLFKVRKGQLPDGKAEERANRCEAAKRTAQTHLVHVQLLLLKLLLVFLQKLLVLLLDDQVLQGLGILGQRSRLCAPQWTVLPQLVDGGGYPVCANQRLCVQGQGAQA